MNPPKCDELDYINFLIAAQKVFSNTEAAKCHPAADSDGPAHDAYTRLLHRCQSDGEALWQEVKPCISRVGGILVVDDSTLDKFYARMIELVTRHWSGKHHRVVRGINLIEQVIHLRVKRDLVLARDLLSHLLGRIANAHQLRPPQRRVNTTMTLAHHAGADNTHP